MKRSLLIVILFFTLTTTLKAQELLFIGEKSYPSTSSFTFSSDEVPFGKSLEIAIARNNRKGMLILSSEVFIPGMIIKGNVLLYLEDGTVIKCLDRGIRDYVNRTATTVYYLTEEEIDILKVTNIDTIRFTMKCAGGECYSETTHNYSVSNQHTKTLVGHTNNRLEYDYVNIDVPLRVSRLFDNPR